VASSERGPAIPPAGVDRRVGPGLRVTLYLFPAPETLYSLHLQGNGR
jgi:hypothetical protein